MTLYRELAEHITEGRAQDVSADDLHAWMVASDIGGHKAWEAFDASLDQLLTAYRTETGDRAHDKETTC